jgi:hypothetical protein
MPRGIGLALGACVIGLLAAAATGLADYWRSFAQNTAADLIGAIVAMYVLIPIAQHPRQDDGPHGDPGQQPAEDPAAAVMPAHSDAAPPGGAAGPPAAAPDTVQAPADTAA